MCVLKTCDLKRIQITDFGVKKLKIIHFSLMFFFTINLKGYLILVLEIFSIDQFSACLVSHYAHMFHITHRQQTITSTYFFKLTRKNLMTCACITYSITYLILCLNLNGVDKKGYIDITTVGLER